MAAVPRALHCLLYLCAASLSTGQETESRSHGFLQSFSSFKKAGWVYDIGSASSIIAFIATDSSDDSSQCVSRDIWDVTQGVNSGLGNFQANSGTAWGSIVLLGIVAASTVSLLWGAKLVKPCLFICAFLVGYYIGMSIAFLWANWLSSDPCTVPLIIGISLGIVCGIAINSFLDKAVFIFGCAIGLVMALMAKTGVVSFVANHSISGNAQTLLDWYWLIAIGCGLLVGCLVSAQEDKLLAVATILVGAWGLSISLMPLLAIWGVVVPAWSCALTFIIAIVVGLLMQKGS